MSGIRVGGLWQKTNDKGVIYYEGSLGPISIRVYENSYKKSPKDPDVVLYFSERPKEGRPQASAPAKAPFQKPAPRMPYKDHTQPAFESDDPGPGSDDLPF